MKLPTVEVREKHYWTVVIRDEFRPDGEEYREFPTREAAEEQLQRFIDKELATHVGQEKEIPE